MQRAESSLQSLYCVCAYVETYETLSDYVGNNLFRFRAHGILFVLEIERQVFVAEIVVPYLRRKTVFCKRKHEIKAAFDFFSKYALAVFLQKAVLFHASFVGRIIFEIKT